MPTDKEENELKKENSKMKATIKKKDRENLEAKQTTRNLNNNLDRLIKEEAARSTEAHPEKEKGKKKQHRVEEKPETKTSQRAKDDQRYDKQASKGVRVTSKEQSSEAKKATRQQEQFYLDEGKLCQYYLDGYCKIENKCWDIDDKEGPRGKKK